MLLSTLYGPFKHSVNKHEGRPLEGASACAQDRSGLGQLHHDFPLLLYGPLPPTTAFIHSLSSNHSHIHLCAMPLVFSQAV